MIIFFVFSSIQKCYHNWIPFYQIANHWSMNRSPAEFAASGTLGPNDNSTECISFREMSNGNLSLKSPFCKCQHCQYTSFDIHMMFCIPACINIHRNLCRIVTTFLSAYLGGAWFSHDSLLHILWQLLTLTTFTLFPINLSRTLFL